MRFDVRRFLALLGMWLALCVPMLAIAATDQAPGTPFHIERGDYFISSLLRGFLGPIVDPNGMGAEGMITGPGYIGEIFRTFNLGIAFFGTLMVVFITVVGVMQSGNDGEFLGKRWSSMWVPVRFAIGSALMLPISSTGFSFVQAMVLWIAAQGVGFGDTLWNKVVDVVVARTTADVWGSIDGGTVAKNVMMSSVCSAAIEYSSRGTPQQISAPRHPYGPFSVTSGTGGNRDTTSEVAVVAWGPYSPAMQQSVQGFGSTNIGNARVCGSLTVTYPQHESDIYREARRTIGSAHTAEVIKMADEFRPLAERFVQAFEAPQQEGVDPFAAPSDEMVRAIVRAGQDYNTAVAGAASTAMGQARANNLGSMTAERMKQYGFVTAGMFYIDMTRLHGAVREAITAPPNYTPPAPSAISETRQNYDLVMGKYGAVSEIAAAGIANSIGAGTSGTPGVKLTPTVEGMLPVIRPTELNIDVKDTMTGAFDRLGAAVINGMFGVGGSHNGRSGETLFSGNFATADNNTSSVLELKSKGDNILDIAGAAATLYVVGTGAANGAAGALGTNAVTGLISFLPGWLGGTLSAALPLAMSALMALFAFGLALAIYLPMAPYILWMGAVIGYLVMIAEALVASSIWAVMLMHPSGEGVTSQQAQSGVMLLLGLFTRPALMLMGMVSGMFMLEPLVMMINDTFYYAMGSNQRGSVTGLFSILAYCALYVSLILTVVNKCFSLIHIMPDKVLGWIGGHAAQLGESSARDHAKGNAGAVAAALGRGVSDLASANEKRAKHPPAEKKGG